MHYLTNSERLIIELKRREVRTKKEHVRLTVLIMLDEGFSQETIALCLGIHSGTVSNWKQKYEWDPEIWTAVDSWYNFIDGPTLADAIMDRLSASAHRIALAGKS